MAGELEASLWDGLDQDWITDAAAPPDDFAAEGSSGMDGLFGLDGGSGGGGGDGWGRELDGRGSGGDAGFDRDAFAGATGTVVVRGGSGSDRRNGAPHSGGSPRGADGGPVGSEHVVLKDLFAASSLEQLFQAPKPRKPLAEVFDRPPSQARQHQQPPAPHSQHAAWDRELAAPPSPAPAAAAAAAAEPPTTAQPRFQRGLFSDRHDTWMRGHLNGLISALDGDHAADQHRDLAAEAADGAARPPPHAALPPKTPHRVATKAHKFEWPDPVRPPASAPPAAAGAVRPPNDQRRQAAHQRTPSTARSPTGDKVPQNMLRSSSRRLPEADLVVPSDSRPLALAPRAVEEYPDHIDFVDDPDGSGGGADDLGIRDPREQQPSSSGAASTAEQPDRHFDRRASRRSPHQNGGGRHNGRNGAPANEHELPIARSSPPPPTPFIPAVVVDFSPSEQRPQAALQIPPSSRAEPQHSARLRASKSVPSLSNLQTPIAQPHAQHRHQKPKSSQGQSTAVDDRDQRLQRTSSEVIPSASEHRRTDKQSLRRADSAQKPGEMQDSPHMLLAQHSNIFLDTATPAPQRMRNQLFRSSTAGHVDNGASSSPFTATPSGMPKQTRDQRLDTTQSRTVAPAAAVAEPLGTSQGSQQYDISFVDLSSRGLTSLLHVQQLEPVPRRLNLSNNQLDAVDQVPSPIEVLYISGNRLVSLTSFGHLTSLRCLDISRNGVRDISALAALRTLREVDASYNMIDSLGSLLSLPNIGILRLQHNQIEEVDMQSLHHRLHTLDLSYNRIRKLKYLQRLVNLQDLNLEFNHLRSLSLSRSMPKLRTLNLGQNRLVAFSGAQFPGLTTLNLDGNCISEIEEPEGLCSLEVLSIENQRTDDQTIVLAGMESLRELRVAGNIVGSTGALAGWFIESLDCRGAQLREIPSSLVQRSSTLWRLCLSHNLIVDPYPLAEIRSLVELDLSFNQISEIGRVMLMLRRLSALRMLDLRGNPITEQLSVSGSRHDDTLRATDTSMDIDPPSSAQAVREICYRSAIISCVGPSLEVLDLVPLTQDDRSHAKQRMYMLKEFMQHQTPQKPQQHAAATPATLPRRSSQRPDRQSRTQAQPQSQQPPPQSLPRQHSQQLQQQHPQQRLQQQPQQRVQQQPQQQQQSQQIRRDAEWPRHGSGDDRRGQWPPPPHDASTDIGSMSRLIDHARFPGWTVQSVPLDDVTVDDQVYVEMMSGSAAQQHAH
ncbi:Protein nud1 [Polyrhizophydium stewartii]|uniref:Protein nud1 n=1 Tax=Polyrhizophydium stewartii TaxID=2732419 RepID=A0ABR4N5J7_9FUNG